MALTHKPFTIDRRTLSSFPKLYLNQLFLALAMGAVFTCSAQRESDVADFSSRSYASSNIQNLNIVFNANKVYINWMVKGEQNDGVYLIERSIDGKEFTAIGYKEVIASSLELLYSWIDTSPIEGSSYYRISRVGQNYDPQVLTASIPVVSKETLTRRTASKK